MAEFKVNADMFGMYARIPTGYSKEMHVYKVVSKFKSNSYCDVPIVYNSKPVIHDKEFSQLSDLEDVLNVIHCGIDETEVIRVALKDCEIVKPTADVVEVVRCIDCAYRRVPVRCSLWMGSTGENDYFREQGDNFYCAFGTPKERGGEK